MSGKPFACEDNSEGVDVPPPQAAKSKSTGANTTVALSVGDVGLFTRFLTKIIKMSKV